MKRKWMLEHRGENFIILKKNKDIKKYEKLKRVPRFSIWLISLPNINWKKISEIGAIVLLTGMTLGVAAA